MCLESIRDELRSLRQAIDEFRLQQRQMFNSASGAGSNDLRRAATLISPRQPGYMAITIVGGEVARAETFNECAAVGRQDIAGFYCSGVLAVNSRLVITAAHCGPAGGSSLPTAVALKATDEQNLAGAEIIDGVFANYPGYVRSGAHDIAVLVLSESSSVPPVDLASTAEMQNATEVTLVGFGDDDVYGSSGLGIKRSVTVPIQFLAGGVSDQLPNPAANLDFDKASEFVVGAASMGACFGDSGGPAYINVNGVRKVAGIVSRPPKSQEPVCSGLTILTRIDVHQAWIMSNLPPGP